MRTIAVLLSLFMGHVAFARVVAPTRFNCSFVDGITAEFTVTSEDVSGTRTGFGVLKEGVRSLTYPHISFVPGAKDTIQINFHRAGTSMPLVTVFTRKSTSDGRVEAELLRKDKGSCAMK